MAPVLIGGAALGALVVVLCIRRLFCKPQPKAFGTMSNDFKFSIEQNDFQGDGSKRLPDVDDEFDIDTELQQQLERTRGAAGAPHRRMEEGHSRKADGRHGELIGDLTSDAHINQEAFEAEMRAELAEFDELVREDIEPARS
ncbi:hypothetical protein T492DRAFT_979688 [Pavlovales sp. CCMP2436]|nr:hypothetical protein T492DRAFT_979688 [Pavlovales sp. CCMP2436]